MKIYAKSREEVLKRKEAWEAEYSEKKSRYDEQKAQYDTAWFDAKEALEAKVHSILDDIGLDVRVSAGYARYGSKGYSVFVSDEDNKFDPGKALAWNWRVELDRDGLVRKESSSWSGLNAVSAENIDYLKKIVQAVERLNDVNWEEVLTEYTTPDVNKYITEDNPDYSMTKPNFDKELMLADIEDAIGQNVLLVGGADVNSRSGRPFGKVYYMVNAETPTQYKITEFLGYTRQIDEGTPIQELLDTNRYNQRRISKSNFVDLLYKPIQKVEF